MWEKVKGFVSAHPWGTAAIVFVVGIVLIYWFRGSGGSAQPAVSNLGPYYNAQAASQAAGASVYDAQISANAATSIALTNADRDLKIAAISAGVANNRIGSDTTLGTLQLANALTLGSEQVDATVKLGSQSTDRAIAASHDAYWAHRSDNETAIALNTSNNGVTSLRDTLTAQTAQHGQTLAAQVSELGLYTNLAGGTYRDELAAIDAYNRHLIEGIQAGTNLGQGLNAALPNSPPPVSLFPAYTTGSGSPAASPLAGYSSSVLAAPVAPPASNPVSNVIDAIFKKVA